MQVNEMRLRRLAHDLGMRVTEGPDGPVICGETFLEQQDLPSGLRMSDWDGEEVVAMEQVKTFPKAA